MDPDACLRRILHAICDNHRLDAVQAMEDLVAWVDKGGALPLATQLQKMMMRDLLDRMPP
jgi:hypothetical protein